MRDSTVISRSDILIVTALLVGAVLGAVIASARPDEDAPPGGIIVLARQSTAVGYGALGAASGAGNNTAVGYKAGEVLAGTGNTAVGTAALLASTNGDSNVAVGLHAGRDLDGSRNVLIGTDSGAVPGVDDSVAIGAGSLATADGQVMVGPRDVETTNGHGLILSSPAGTRWRVTVDNGGQLVLRRL